ncbi:hypothetical protein [Sedimentibacter sp.]|uniref:hypothetical protein n=1 Tax=Sedimentibacter sp. TaxID=1960295 RepID=UPI0028A95726|nr:hypothetical protein [Sedimentibacter sp.]
MAQQIIYPILFILVIYFIFINFRNNMNYKKQNMKVLFQLKDDDKKRQTFSNILIIFILAMTTFMIVGMINSDEEFGVESIFTMVVLPLLMIGLYIPLTKKTFVSTLGIHKRGGLIKWESIKNVNYYKPNEKGMVIVKILHTITSREVSADILINKDDELLNVFKETVKEYRNTKKKEKKSGK